MVHQASARPEKDAPKADRLIALFKRFIRDMAKMGVHAHPAWRGASELTLGQIRTLMMLEHAGTASVGAVSRWLEIGEPSASQVVDSLVKGNLVTRTEDPEDRRRALIRLSEAGHSLVEERIQIREDLARRFLSRIHARDLVALERGLRAVLRTMDSTSGRFHHVESVVSPNAKTSPVD